MGREGREGGNGREWRERGWGGREGGWGGMEGGRNMLKNIGPQARGKAGAGWSADHPEFETRGSDHPEFGPCFDFFVSNNVP